MLFFVFFCCTINCFPFKFLNTIKSEDTWNSVNQYLCQSDNLDLKIEQFESLLNTQNQTLMTHNSQNIAYLALRRLRLKNISASSWGSIQKMVQTWYFCLLSSIFYLRGLGIPPPSNANHERERLHFSEKAEIDLSFLWLCEQSLTFRLKMRQLKREILSSGFGQQNERECYVKALELACGNLIRFPESFDLLFTKYYGKACAMRRLFCKNKQESTNQLIIEHVQFWYSFIVGENGENSIANPNLIHHHPGNDIWPKKATSTSIAYILCQWESLVQRLESVGIVLKVENDDFECVACGNAEEKENFLSKCSISCLECTSSCHKMHLECISASTDTSKPFTTTTLECKECQMICEVANCIPLMPWLMKFQQSLKQMLEENDEYRLKSQKFYLSYDDFLEEITSLHSAISKSQTKILLLLSKFEVPLAKEILLPIAKTIIHTKSKEDEAVNLLNSCKLAPHFEIAQVEQLGKLYDEISIGSGKELYFLWIADCFALVHLAFDLLKSKFEADACQKQLMKMSKLGKSKSFDICTSLQNLSLIPVQWSNEKAKKQKHNAWKEYSADFVKEFAC